MKGFVFPMYNTRDFQEKAEYCETWVKYLEGPVTPKGVIVEDSMKSLCF